MTAALHTCRTNSECDARLQAELESLFNWTADHIPAKTMPEVRAEAAIFAAHGYGDFAQNLVNLADLHEDNR